MEEARESEEGANWSKISHVATSAKIRRGARRIDTSLEKCRKQVGTKFRRKLQKISYLHQDKENGGVTKCQSQKSSRSGNVLAREHRARKPTNQKDGSPSRSKFQVRWRKKCKILGWNFKRGCHKKQKIKALLRPHNSIK
jgi:hypothetical protein